VTVNGIGIMLFERFCHEHILLTTKLIYHGTGMNILLIDNGSAYITELKRLLSSHNVTHIKYNLADLATAGRYDLIILSGGHTFSVVNHDLMYEKELDIIKKSLRPILGICLGSQLIAHAYGAKIEKMDYKEHGMVKMEIIQSDRIFKGIEETSVQVFENHRWVIREVPPVFDVLATSKDGIEVIKHCMRPIYGFQFHPEMFTEKTQGDEIFANVINLMQERTNQ
jgi:GMP synthase-like glutamine amidotransferase